MEEFAINQRGVSREVATLHFWVPFMVKNCDQKERDNAVNYALHRLCDAAEPQHIVDALLA